MKHLLLLCAVLISSVFVCAHQEIPGDKQARPIAIINARIYTVSGPVIEKGTIVFDKGKITAVGANAEVPPGADILDCRGKSVYPSLIAPNTVLGLTEIDAARPTRDMQESGDFNANARAEVAYNPDSEILPTVRSNGILICASVPQGGVVSGTASIMMLDGWTREDCALKSRAALVVNFPSLATFSAPYITKTADEQRKENEKQVKELYEYFEKAKMYWTSARAGLSDQARDIRLEAMRGVFDQQLPVMISCSEYKQILAAIDFAKHFNLKAILVGCEDGARCLKEIKASGYGVIAGRVHSLPRREDEGYDKSYQLPRQLSAAGIVFAYSDGGSWQQRNLPFQAGSSVAFGISEEEALKGLTLNPAKLFGIDKEVGSLEVGKDATLFVSSGNCMDELGNKLEYAFVQGRKISLDSKQTRLAEKFRTKFRRQK